LRAHLAEAGYTTDRIAERLGGGRISFAPVDVVVHLRRLPPEEPFAALVRLLLLGLTLDVEHVERAFWPLDLETLLRSGWLEARGGGVGAVLKVVPHGDLLIASDHDAERPPGFDWVAGIHPPSVTLAKLTVRQNVERSLDIGTGNGIQALLASRHARFAVATDVNPRALAIATLNTRLNDVANLEYRQGSYFEPVAGEQFDLLTCNPPYVISPETQYAFRDSGLERDDVSRHVVQAAPHVLREGGFAHLLVSWAHSPGDWSTPLERWVDGSGCDVWLLYFGSDDPITYAAGWLKPIAGTTRETFEKAFTRWLNYLERHDITAIAHGAVILRRRTGGRNWLRKDTCSLDRLEQAGDHILRVFDAEDYLNSLTEPSQLLDADFALVATHHLEQTTTLRNGQPDATTNTIALDEGIGFRAALDDQTAALLPLLDGKRPLRAALARRAADLNLHGKDAARFQTAAIPAVRRLIQLGLLAQTPVP